MTSLRDNRFFYCFIYKVQVNKEALLRSDELELPNGLKMNRSGVDSMFKEEYDCFDIVFEV